MKKLFSIILIFIFYLSTCSVSYARMMPKVSKEKLQNMQTAYFDATDKYTVIQSVISTLYDSDFKAAYTSKKRVAGWSFVLAAATAYTVFSYGATAASMYSPSRRIATEFKDKTVVIDANVFVEQVDTDRVKVRFVPVEKVLQNADGFAFNQMAPIKVIRIYKPDAYKEFFAQVENNLK